MPNLFDAWVELKLRDKDFRRNVKTDSGLAKGLQKNLTGVGGAAKKASRGIAGVTTALLGGAGLIFAVKKAGSEFMAFEKGMNRVNTLLDSNQDATRMWGESIQDMSIRYGSTIPVITNGLFQAISASVNTADAMEFMDVAAKLAVGGVTELDTAVNGLTTIMNSYGMASSEAGKAADFFSVTQKRGKTTVQELASFVGQVSPLAAQLGIRMEELGAAFSVATKAGINTASTAAALRQLFAAMAAPTRITRRVVKELGLDLTQANLRAKGLAGVMGELMAATGGNAELLRRSLGSIEAFNVISALTSKGGALDFNKILIEQTDLMGEHERQASRMTQNIEMRARQFSEVVNKSFRVIGTQAFGMMSREISASAEGFVDWSHVVERSIKSAFAELPVVLSVAKKLATAFAAIKISKRCVDLGRLLHFLAVLVLAVFRRPCRQ